MTAWDDNPDRDKILPGQSSLYYSCIRKRQYDTLAAARLAAHQTKRLEGIDLYPYRCEHCGKWHLTKEKRK